MSCSRLRPRCARCTGLACSRSETTRPSPCLRSLRRQASSCREGSFRCNTSLTWHHRDRNLQSVHASLFENVVHQCRGSGNNNLCSRFNSDMTDIITLEQRGKHVPTAWFVRVGPTHHQTQSWKHQHETPLVFQACQLSQVLKHVWRWLI